MAIDWFRLALALLLISATSCATSSPASTWAGSWSTAVYDPGVFANEAIPGLSVGGRTIRNIVRPTLAGNKLRLRFTNKFGDAALVIGSVHVAPQLNGAATQRGRSVPVLFGKNSTVTLPPGATVYSDPVNYDVQPSRKIAVSIYLPNPMAQPTSHLSGWQTSYLSTNGDHTDAFEGGVFDTKAHAWFFLDRLDVATSANQSPPVIVAIGDSLTAGGGTSVDADRRWTDFLDRKHASAGRDWAVLNAGINGNPAIWRTNCFGQPASVRLRTDVLDQAGVSTVIIIVGANDLIQPRLPGSDPKPGCIVPGRLNLEDLKEAYRKMISQARSASASVLMATILPFSKSSFWSPAVEQERGLINDWIRSAGLADGIVDLAVILADPTNSLRLRPEYDSGDGLHPNDAGAEAIAVEAERELQRVLAKDKVE